MFRKLLKKKIKDITVGEFLEIIGEKGVFYKDVTEECKFKPFCVGGSNDSKYGCNSTYYDLGIYHNGDLIFKLDCNSFKEKSIMPVKDWTSEREYKFHWLDNGTFMIVKKIEK